MGKWHGSFHDFKPEAAYTQIYSKMGGCQNYGPFLGTLYIRCRIIIRIQKGTIILPTTQMLLPPGREALGLVNPVRRIDLSKGDTSSSLGIVGLQGPGFRIWVVALLGVCGEI